MRSFTAPASAAALAMAFASLTHLSQAASQPGVGWKERPDAAYRFRTLDNPASAQFTSLRGINDAGVICGYYGSGGAKDPSEGFTLKPPYAASDFAASNLPGAAETQVLSINANGDTAGTAWVGHKRVPFIEWRGRFTAYQHGPMSGLNSAGFAVVVGENKEGEKGSEWSGLLDRRPRHIEKIEGGDQYGGGGVNDKNDVVGWVNSNGCTISCFENGWARVGGQFVSIVYPGGFLTYPSGINNDDEIVGTYLDAASHSHGFVAVNVLSSPVFSAVDDPNGVGSTSASGVNDSGQLVGSYVDGAGKTHGFLATPR